MHFRSLGAAALSAAVVLIPTAAIAGGSDSPTPYTVTAAGLQLPAGTTFEANGHINYTVTRLDGSGARQFNVHESMPHNGQWPQGAYIGKDYYPWTDHPDFRAAFPGDYCLVWVQVSAFNEHFGEGGQGPVCTTDREPTPTDPADPTPEPTPTDPADPADPTPKPTPTDPADPADPTPTDRPTTPVGATPPPKTDPTPTPTDPTGPVEPEGPAQPTEPATPLTPTDSGLPVTPTAPATPPAPTDSGVPVTPTAPAPPLGTTEPVTPTDPSKAAPTQGGGGSTTDAQAAAEAETSAQTHGTAALASSPEQLARTGTSAEAVALLVAGILAAGSVMVLWARRARPERGEG